MPSFVSSYICGAVEIAHSSSDNHIEYTQRNGCKKRCSWPIRFGCDIIEATITPQYASLYSTIKLCHRMCPHIYVVQRGDCPQLTRSPYRVYWAHWMHETLLMTHKIQVWYHRSDHYSIICLIVFYNQTMPSYVSWCGTVEIAHSSSNHHIDYTQRNWWMWCGALMIARSSSDHHIEYFGHKWCMNLFMFIAHCVRLWYHRSVVEFAECVLHPITKLCHRICPYEVHWWLPTVHQITICIYYIDRNWHINSWSWSNTFWSYVFAQCFIVRFQVKVIQVKQLQLVSGA